MTDVIRNEVEELKVEEPKEEEKKVEEPKEEEKKVEEPKEEEKKVEPRIGIVVGCSRLNVRKKPTKAAEVHCVIDKGMEVEIDDNRPESKWVRVIVNGVVGFCMREYIQEV